MTNRIQNQGELGAHKWWLDAMGNPTNDPTVVQTNPPGSLMPLGGVEAGYKGFSLALFVEAMTGGLTGHGRIDEVDNWGATVYLQLTDCEAFGGRTEFERQMQWLVDKSVANKPIAEDVPVRVPGQRAMALRTHKLRDGVSLHPSIEPALAILADSCGLEMPERSS